MIESAIRIQVLDDETCLLRVITHMLTGLSVFSSLPQFHEIPFDERKIDQSFVYGVWRNETSRAMCEASLGLGKLFGIEVAEVEDCDDRDLVRLTKCDMAQGYFISRSMPGANLASWIAWWHERPLQSKGGIP